MRNMLVVDQNNDAWNGLSQKDADAFMRAAGDLVEGLSGTGEWVGGVEKG